MILPVLLTFGAVFFVVLGIFLAVQSARQSPEAEVKRRLGRLAGPDDVSAPAELLKATSPADRMMFGMPGMDNLQRLVEQAGLQVAATKFIVVTGAASFAIFLLTLVIKKNILVAGVAAAIAMAAALLILRYRKRQREEKFLQQLPDALTMIARSLRAGHSLTAAVELVGEELPEPVVRFEWPMSSRNSA